MGKKRACILALCVVVILACVGIFESTAGIELNSKNSAENLSKALMEDPLVIIRFEKNPLYISPREKFKVFFQGMPGREGDTLCLCRIGSKDEEHITCLPLQGKSEGMLEFAIPEEAGDYEIRAWSEGKTKLMAVSEKLKVEWGPAILCTEFTEFCIDFGTTFNLFYSGTPGFSDDNIEMYLVRNGKKEMVHHQSLGWAKSNLIVLPAPTVPGEYHVSLWAKGKTVELARSHPLYVNWTLPSLMPVLLPPNEQGERKLLLEFSGTPGHRWDWIGLFKAGSKELSVQEYGLYEFENEGSLEFDVPEKSGFYEFRLYSDRTLVHTSPAINSRTGEVTASKGNQTYPARNDTPLCLKAYTGGSKVFLEWTPPDSSVQVKSYRIYRRKHKEAEFTSLVELAPSDLSYLDSEVSLEEVLFYRVAPLNEAGIELKVSNVALVLSKELSLQVSLPPQTWCREYSFSGKVLRGSKVWLNEREIAVHPAGNFLASLELLPGSNLIKVRTKSKTGEVLETPYQLELMARNEDPPTPVKKVLILLKIGNRYARVNDQPVELDLAPFIYQGRTLVPFRFIGESLGAEVGFTTDSSGRVVRVSYTLGETYVMLFIGRREALVNGKSFELDAPPRILHGRTIIPIRFTSEALGCEVLWNPETQEITIHFPVLHPV